jgi:general secretion pathway protein G
MKRIKNLKLKIKNSIRGFTLVELLIVIAIIGVLSTLLMANFIGVRQRARDAQRKSDLRQIQAALEIYRSDNGGYPALVAVGVDGYESDNGTSSCTGNGTIQLGTTIYMKKIPCDPLGDTYFYIQLNSGGGYSIYACLENSSDKDLGTTPAACGAPRASRYIFTVNNP